MNIKEVATLFGVKEKSKSMKNKKRAKEIVEEILKCKKCGSIMKWVEGTNVCVCQNCTYSVKRKDKTGKKDIVETYNVSRIISEKSQRFLENNYHCITEESKEGK